MARLSSVPAITLLAATMLSGCYRASHVHSVERAIGFSRAMGDTSANSSTPDTAGSSATTPAVRSLDLGEAIQTATRLSPDLAAIRARARAARAEMLAGARPESPELRWTNVDFGEGTRRSEIAVRTEPPLPGRLQARAEIARARYEQASADSERERQLLVLRVRRLFAESLLYEQAAGVATDATEVDKRAADLASTERNRSTMTLGQAAELSLRSSKERLRAERIARRLSESRLELNTLLHLPDAGAVRLVGSLPDPAAAPPPDPAALENALRQRPEVKAAGAGVESAAARTWLERSELWPWFSFVQLGYDFDPSGAEAWTAGVALEIPIFEWTSHRSRAAEAGHVSARRAFEATVRDIIVDAQKSLVRFDEAGADLARFRSGPLRAATEARNAMAGARRAGHATERDLLDADFRWLEARVTELELVADYIRAENRWLEDIGDGVDPGALGESPAAADASPAHQSM